jgi:NADPH-dependent 2,4-dienoyl-CoA reductase/sulfur reductase-like enzyme
VPRSPTAPAGAPRSIVIVGAGAAGNACAEKLRHLGYAGSLTLVGDEETVPVDRPNLSKDYLAGTAPEEWIPLRGRDFYRDAKIDLVTGVRATALDAKARKLTLADGRVLDFDALVLATGATPHRLNIPGADRPEVHYLRSLRDSQALIARAKGLRSAVVLGASFIGLEVAASLRARDIEVHVVAPDARPLERVLGAALGDFVRALHEEKGVHFHLGRKPTAIAEGTVTLDDQSQVTGQMVVAGIGVAPNLALAESAGLRMDRGVAVSELLETSAPGIYAVGDIARWPDPRAGAIRVEHWVVAERQGQAAARNLLGPRQPFRQVPFFWSQHYDVPICYVGHCEKPDAVTVHGSLRDRNGLVAYRVSNKVQAVASIYRDLDSLAIEAALERDDQAAIEKILAGVA